MARLDKLIQVLHDQRAESLRLVAGRTAVLWNGGGPGRSLTRDVLSAAQIIALIREIAPSGGPEGSPDLDFTYSAPAGAIQVSLSASGEEASAVLRPAGSTSSSAPAPGMEELLRAMVEQGASDLHLRANEPPLLRISGQLARMDQPPVSDEELRAMLFGIMSETDRAGWAEHGDADWAW
ncbi:MAG: hypothetical protein ACREL6_10550, partial [Gemmatimonadales bacterium]